MKQRPSGGAAGREENRPLSLYLHIPFCLRKCRYCDFLSAPAAEETREAYTAALCRELDLAAADLTRSRGGIPKVDTVFFGGGTPSLLTAAQIDRLLDSIRSSFRLQEAAEITLEANPGTLGTGRSGSDMLCLDTLRELRAAGINRISLGVQSFRDEELSLLGRIHTAEEALRSCRAVQEAGFENWSLDLMSGLPGQTLSHWEESLRTAAALEPPHLSAYSLIIEEGTPFASMKLPPLPSEEEDRAMVRETAAILASCGLRRYEISNYARPGYESRHNSGYWTGHDYLGLGIGASSYVDGTRFRNITDLGRYIKLLSGKGEGETRAETGCGTGISTGSDTGNRNTLPDDLREDVQILSDRDRMEEFMFLGLRMTGGISGEEFGRRFGVSLDSVYGGILRRQLATGLLRRTGDRYALTEEGMDVSNVLMAEYLF